MCQLLWGLKELVMETCCVPLSRITPRMLARIGLFLLVSNGLGLHLRADELEWRQLNRADEISALELVSVRITENLSRIQTWSGIYRYRELGMKTGKMAENFARFANMQAHDDGRNEIYTAAPAYVKISDVRCDFSIDVAGGSLFSSLTSIEPPRVVAAHSGEPLDLLMTGPSQWS